MRWFHHNIPKPKITRPKKPSDKKFVNFRKMPILKIWTARTANYEN